jgi:hypothetical protein
LFSGRAFQKVFASGRILGADARRL